MPKKLCKECGIEFIARKERVYCSKKCYTKTQMNKKPPCEFRAFGKNNPMWKGKKVGLSALHEWVGKYKKKPKLCECCNEKEPMDLANKSGDYNRDLNDWNWLCRSCHMILDGRMAQLRWSKL